ncbi:MBL fold metallo-hydrolase [uncultured Microbacterium sp.]|uniref:MBL fold metallo-hydrolase n=1 Tax=uncultured Microbacterium sp. TaxID=191216 RepID=UPI0035CA6D2D
MAPGIYRLGDDKVNFYLVDREGTLLLVDAGLPSHYAQLEDLLTALGRSVADITAILLTHAHPDHVGLAQRVQNAGGAPVWVHAADAPIVQDPSTLSTHWKAERSMVGYILRRPAMLAVPIHLARSGAFKAKAVTTVRTFTGGETLPVAGIPIAISVPGHTSGSAAFLFPGVIFTGDALVTRDDLVGRSGPRTVARAFTQSGTEALASLDVLADLDASLVLPGHGDPYIGSIAAAAKEAIAAGVS